MSRLRFLALWLAVAAAPVLADPVQIGRWKDATGQIQQLDGVVLFNADGSIASLTGGAGSGGPITAADGAIVGIGTLSSPATGSTNYWLGQIYSRQGAAPLQSGGLVTDANNASYVSGVPSTATSGTFYRASGDTSGTVTRGVKFDGSGGCSATVTNLLGNATPLGHVVSATSPGYDGFAEVTWASLTAGCTITGLY